MVTSQDIAQAIRNVGVDAGDTVLIHSSLKSFGPIDGGVQAVIDGVESVLTKEGTLVLPTLCQVDFINSYKTWYMDKPSDVGYLTEYFRKLPYVYRSNQATHSVAARGKNAYQLTFEHTAYGPHLCPFGEYAFADSSPWKKLYDMDAKVLFFGVTMRYNTMKHPIEARVIEYYLSQVKDPSRADELKAQLMTFESFPKKIWLFYNSEKMQAELEQCGLVRSTTCGNARILCVDAKQASDKAFELLIAEPEKWFDGEKLEWILACQSAT